MPEFQDKTTSSTHPKLTGDTADGEIGLPPASLYTLWLRGFEFYLRGLIIRGRVFTSAIVDPRKIWEM